MENLSALIALFVLNGFWQVTVIVLVAAFSSRLLNRGRAYLQNLLWRGALALCLVLPISTAISGVRAQDRSRETRGPSVYSLWPSRSLPVAMPGSGELALVSLFFLTACCRSARLLAQALRTITVLRSTKHGNGGPVDRLAARAAAGYSRERIDIRFSESQYGPCTVGCFRPVIILPQWFAFEPSDELLVAAVAHEMAHVRRADFAWLLIEESLLTCLAYHPLAMLIRRRLHQTRETACDEVAAMLVPDRKSYAHSLLTIASNVATPRSAAIAFAGEDFTGLRDRIRRLASPPRRQPAWMPAVAGFLILVTASLAGSHAVTIERPAYISPNLNIIAKASPAITVYQSPGADRIFKDTRRKGVGTSARRRQDYPPPPPPPPPPPEILNDQR